MTNIHILPTDKPSRLFYLASNLHLEQGQLISPKNYQNIHITSDVEIKVKDWVISKSTGELIKSSKSYCANNEYGKKIILTTDQDLIKDGVQAIDDEFLEWFVNNPSCEEVEIFIDTMGCVLENCNANPCINYKIIIPKEEPTIEEEYLKDELKKYDGIDVVVLNKPEEPKQETLEEAAKRIYGSEELKDVEYYAFINGAKWQQERMYSEEDLISFAHFYFREEFNSTMQNSKSTDEIFNIWFEQFKKKV